jgi:hypothetical protein
VAGTFLHVLVTSLLFERQPQYDSPLAELLVRE